MSKANILIVEDEVIIAMELQSNLECMGYQVTAIVNNGPEAINRVETDRPDLVIMDIRIKGEMDGIDAATMIRSRFATPVVFTTAYLDEERIERAKITMPFGYILKPIQTRDLKVTIEMALYVSKVDRERQLVNEALEQSERMYRTLFAKNINPIAIIDSEGRYLEANSAFLAFVQKSREQLLAMSVFDFSPPDKEQEQQSEHKPTWESGGTLETEYYIDEEIKTLELSISPVLFKGKHAVIGIGKDITQRKKIENQLLSSEKKYRKIFGQMQIPYVEANLEGTILEISPSVNKHIQYTRDELIGTSILDLYADPQLRDRLVQKLLDTGELLNEEIQVKNKDGTIRHALLFSKYIEEEQKIVGSLVNISDYKRREEELLQEIARLRENAGEGS